SQPRGQLRVVDFRGRRDSGWVDGIAKADAQRAESLKKLLAAGPRLVEALNRHRHNGHLQMRRQNCGALLEDFRFAVNAALTFWKQEENATMAKSESAGAHGRNQIGIGIHHHDPQKASDAPHEAGTEHIARTNREEFLKDLPGQKAGNDKGIKVALMIG